jgi:hypothetical protein
VQCAYTRSRYLFKPSHCCIISRGRNNSGTSSRLSFKMEGVYLAMIYKPTAKVARRGQMKGQTTGVKQRKAPKESRPDMGATKTEIKGGQPLSVQSFG